VSEENGEVAMNNIERIMEALPDETFVKWDGLDAAIMGVDLKSLRLIYSVDKIYTELQKQGMTMEEAVEWYDFNVDGAYIGEKTPIHCNELF
jgi:hypothetical protein